MRRLLAALALAALAGIAAAQSPPPGQRPERIYAVVAMVGDRLVVLNRGTRTGSNIERNDRTLIELLDTSLNESLAEAVYDAVEKRAAGAPVAIMTVRDPSLWSAQNRLVESGASSRKLVEALKPFLERLPATHLVLASKMRREALFDVGGSHVSGGRAEGLGFYLDRHMSMPSGSGFAESARGFLGMFAHFRLSLIEVRSATIVREQEVAASSARVPENSLDDPWETMSAAAKIEALTKLMQDEGARAVAALLPQ